MAKHDIFGRLAQQVGERLQDVSRGPEEIQRTVQSAMRSAFDRMELVSREDFDVMMEVLQRTRSRVEDLERQVTRLEAALDERDGKSAGGATPSEMSAAAAPGGASTTAEAERLAGEHDAPAAPVDAASTATDTSSARTGSATASDKTASSTAAKSSAKTTRGSGKRASGADDQSGQGTAD
ncbi:BMFP domain-containing protein YqiC [Kushneria avicenniae]|uniref:Ubiquinone biosynthesis accessory factor UbiK n=1 Tax=Kushneria avicenniae TaxID=402385 RepID=A0A1I1JAG2_9GAMM|nr:accessory factor UbiK family protein [Kushneria avicenniae]SFC45577.1 BMFP domain-containing protein YqiC [Kushneria avicenniae]